VSALGDEWFQWPAWRRPLLELRDHEGPWLTTHKAAGESGERTV
jgi:hypothetical protein